MKQIRGGFKYKLMPIYGGLPYAVNPAHELSVTNKLYFEIDDTISVYAAECIRNIWFVCDLRGHKRI